MPLVIMCGIPGSGKTKRANQIKNYLQTKHKKRVILINQQSLGIGKDQGFVTTLAQKTTRGRIKFQVQKNLQSDTIVICDSSNYIKGYRYQMYCIARQVKTTYTVVFCNSSLQASKQFNQKRTGDQRFSQQVFQAISKRMQRPQLKNRWDVPLFERRQQQQTPLQQIADVLLFQQKKSKDPVSTKQDQKLSQNYLQQLDTLMQQINQQVLSGKIKLKNNWSAIQLKKIKKDFTNIAKQRPQSLVVLKKGYMDYLIQADKRK